MYIKEGEMDYHISATIDDKELADLEGKLKEALPM